MTRIQNDIEFRIQNDQLIEFRMITGNYSNIFICKKHLENMELRIK